MRTSSSEISRIRPDDPLWSIIPLCRLAGFLCPAEFPSVRAVMGDMLEAVEAPSLDVVFAGSRVAGVSRYRLAAPSEISEVCVEGEEGVVDG